jgi:glutathione synthase/RimK-type ligase-like ATP-grasp enzyme
LFVDQLSAEAVAEAHARFGPDIIAKPQISAGAHETIRLAAGDRFEGGPGGPAMLQPFMPAVSGEGELSLLFFDGVFSHAVGKVAKAGDFRVQFQHGGSNAAITPRPDAFEAAVQVLAAAGRPLTYARVDLIRDPQGRLRLMELEAIEPDLYLEFAPDSGAAFARAMRRALEAGL